MTFFPLSLKVLAITLAITVLAGVAVALTRPKSIDSAVLGSEWQCYETSFVITTCALRTQRQAVPALEITSRVAVRRPANAASLAVGGDGGRAMPMLVGLGSDAQPGCTPSSVHQVHPSQPAFPTPSEGPERPIVTARAAGTCAEVPLTVH
jgi:hypothetical protein